MGAPNALATAFVESTVYNAAARPLYLEDCILDLLLGADPKDVNSAADASLFISNQLKKWLEFENDIEFDTLSKRLLVKYVLWKQTKSIPTESALGKLVHKVKNASIEDKVLVIYTRPDKVGKLCVRIPALDTNDETSMKVLSLLLELACLLHGVSSENLSVLEDPKLDKTPLEISASLLKQLNRLKAAAKNSFGHWDGPNVTFGAESSFKTTPPGLLAAIRLLTSKDVLLRKISYGNKSPKKAVTAFKLQETFNTVLGLKTDKSVTFVIRLLKAILASSVKPHNRGFPGGFIHQNRQQNGVKNEMSVLTLLGWTPKIPSQDRLESVVFNRIDRTLETASDGKERVSSRKVVNIKKEKLRATLPEFRTAVALTVPKLIFPSDEPFDSQIKKGPLEVNTSKVITNFVDNEVQRTVDLMQQSYAIGVSRQNPKSKTTLAHVDNARATFISSTAKMNIVDGKGQKYDHFSDLPEQVQLYLRKRFNYHDLKRKHDEAPQTEEPMQVDTQVVDLPPQLPPAKKRVVGNSAADLRKGSASKTKS